MNIFKQTWQTMFDADHQFDQIKFIGRTAYGIIGDTIRLRFDLTEMTTRDQFNAITITTFNKNQGVIDTLVLQFADIWGRKKVDNPYFSDGIVPYIWYQNNDKKYIWYIYEPTKKDYKLLMDTINEYADIYR